MKMCYLTDNGKMRDHNEDSVIITSNESGEYLMAIADGMGGHRAGEIASDIAVSYLKNEFENSNSIGEKIDAIQWLKRSAKEINEAIFQYAEDYPESKGLGTTLVVAVITKEYILMASVGDSTGYAMKENKLHKITHEHTLVNLLFDTGELTEEQARNHPKKNILMKALGANDPVELDIFDVDMEVDSILLCSDGLTNMLTDEQIEKVLNSEATPEEKIAKLIKKSNNRGGTDNISIAYLITEMDGE